MRSLHRMRHVRSSLLFLLLLLAFAWSAGQSHVRAQEAPLPKPATQQPAPLEPTPTPSAEITPASPPSAPDLIPADILPPPDQTAPAPLPDIPTIEQLDEGLKPPPLSPAAEAYRLHVEWRKLRNRVQNDPAVKAAFARAEAARTDLEKRKLLARYHELFYRKMTAIAPPEMKTYLNDRKREQLAALPQPRVRPETAPPTPTPAKQAGSPSPSASPFAPYGTPTPTPSPSRGLFGLPRP